MHCAAWRDRAVTMHSRLWRNGNWNNTPASVASPLHCSWASFAPSCLLHRPLSEAAIILWFCRFAIVLIRIRLHRNWDALMLGVAYYYCASLIADCLFYCIGNILVFSLSTIMITRLLHWQDLKLLTSNAWFSHWVPGVYWTHELYCVLYCIQGHKAYINWRCFNLSIMRSIQIIDIIIIIYKYVI